MQSQIPRNITRSGYLGMQHALRARDSREDAGLPAHPANDWIECPRCEGAGEVDVVQIDVDDFSSNPCPRCYGAGEIQDGHIDPLVKLQAARRRRRSYINNNARWEYEHARRVAMRPVSRIAQAEMLAIAARCVTASRIAA